MTGKARFSSALWSRYALVSILWFVAALSIKPFFAYVDFGVFYSTAIEKILAGAPLDIYSFVAYAPGAKLALPLTNPPVWFFYLSPLYALGRALGLSDFQRQSGLSYGQAWILIATLPLDILLCRTVLRLGEGAQRMAEPQRWYLFLCLLCSPLLWLSSVRFGHNESLMVLLVLLAIAAGERDRPGLSGVMWGLALGIKTTAVVPALIYFGWGLGRGRRRPAAITVLATTAVFLAPVLPYLLFRREQIAYALLGIERVRPVGGYVLWKLMPTPNAMAASSTALILALSAGAGLWLARRPGRSFLACGGAWALVLGQVFLLLFGKAIFVWYTLAASCFLYLAATHQKRWKGTIPIVPLLASLVMWILQSGAWVGEAIDPSIRFRSAIWVVLLLGIGTWAIWNLIRQEGDAARPGEPSWQGST